MKTPAALMQALKQKRLIPTDAEPYNRYDLLEADLLQAILHEPQLRRHSMYFDTECIDEARDYEALLWQFLEAFPGEHGVESLSCRAIGDGDESEVACEVVRRGKKVRGRWSQTMDYVTLEFMALAEKLTRTREWHPVPVETGDQTYVQVYLEAPLARKLAKFRKDSAVSREAFLTRGDPESECRLGHIEILPEAGYDEVLAALADRYLEPGGDWGDLAKWRGNDVLELCLTSGEYFINCREGVPAVYPDIDLCLGQTQWKYQQVLLPDEDCWFLGLYDRKLHIIFEYAARRIGSHVLGELPSESAYATEPHLLAAKDLRWVCYLEQQQLSPPLAGNGMRMSRLILAGEPVAEAAGSRCFHLSDDRSYPVYRRIMERLEAELSPQGFVRDRVTSFSREADGFEHWVRARRVQDHLGDPIIIEVRHTLLLAKLSERFMRGDMFGMQLQMEPATNGLPKDDSAENAWRITGRSDAGQIASEILAYVHRGLGWLNAERTPSQLIEQLLVAGKHIEAAVVAKAYPESGDAETILIEGLTKQTERWAREGFVERTRKYLGVDLSKG